ncbi:MAG: putative Ig domain-containing protein [Pseudomonadales bacterium]
MKRVTTALNRLSAPIGVLVALLGALASAPALAGPLNCSVEYQVQQTFANGASWDMCWERRSREGIVFKDVHYTTPDGMRLKVLAQANVAQIHVPYDDNGARYHDVSDYGLGTDSYLNDLQASDCPAGERLLDGTRNVICKTLLSDQLRVADGGNTQMGEALTLFSVSHVGAYNYIPEWRFFDDGTLEPSMGATGRLQRYTSNAAYGWPVRDASSSYGVSHIHNYYWRLDFDIGDDANNDVFEEIEFEDGPDSGSRSKRVSAFDTEAARSVAPEKQRFWRVRDSSLTNANGAPISFDLIALNTGHRDEGPSNEPWTFNDIYVTQAKDCERFVSRNPADATLGCASNEDVTDFVNGQSLAGEDLVVWYGLTFHHIPRDEDEPYMHAHWNQFRIAPRDWTAGTTAANNEAPVFAAVTDQTGTVGEGVSLTVSASDPDNDPISYSATGLPAGLSIASASGLITGTLTTAGSFGVTLAAADDRGAASTLDLQWTVAAAPNTAPVLTVPGSQVATVGDTVQLQLSASDGDGDPLNYSASGLPAGLSLGPSTGMISGSATTPGDFTVSIVVRDPDGAQDTGSFLWQVSAAPNNPPILNAVASQSTEVNSPVTLQISATDADGDALEFMASGLPAGLTISAGGLIVGTPTAAGTYTVVLTVIDGNGGSDSGSFGWGITQIPISCPGCVNFNDLGNVSYSNQDFSSDSTIVQGGTGLSMVANTWRRTTETFAITANTVVAFDFESTSEGEIHGLGFDEDDGLSSNRVFKVHGTQGWGLRDFDNYAGGQQSYEIPVGQYFTGSAMYLVLVNDKDSGTLDNNSVFSNIRVYEQAVVNQPPTISTPGDQSTIVGTNVDLTLSASDPEGRALQFSGTGLPDGLTLQGTTGRITGSPGVTGSYSVSVTVTDDQAATATANWNWAVVAQPNRAPVLVNPGAQTSFVDEVVDLQFAASDPDADPLNYTVNGLPTGLSMNSSGRVTGAASVSGSTVVTLTVEDPSSATDSVSFDWDVAIQPVGCVDCINLLVAGNSSYSNQDISADATVVDDGLGLALLGNTWRRTAQTFEINANTVLEVDFESSSQGEIHGIGFDEDNNLSSNRIFRLHGTQNWGIGNYAGYSGGTVRYQIPVGQFYTGSAMSLILVNDKDSGTLDNRSLFRNIRLIQGGNIAPVIDQPGQQQTLLGAAVDFQLSASDINGDALTFAVSGLPDGLNADAAGRVAGVASSVGVFSVVVVVSDSSGAQASVTFDWTVSDGCNDCVDFGVTTTVSYANQDYSQSAEVLDGGEAVSLRDNTWRRTERTYTVTANTVVEFQFSSDAQGEIHGIGFDEDNSLSSNRIFKVHGTQNYGLTTFDNYAGGIKTYRIPVGQYFTGNAMYLVLVNDNDAAAGNQSTFRNVRVFEE